MVGKGVNFSYVRLFDRGALEVTKSRVPGALTACIQRKKLKILFKITLGI
jgi:hypothetical protein